MSEAPTDALVDAMRDAALTLALVIGIEDNVPPSIDTDQIPAPIWRAARGALDFLAAGIGLADAAPDPLNDTEIAHILDPRRTRDAR